MGIGEGRALFVFRTIIFSLIVILVCEAVALTAVTWSFLESASSAFQFIKSASDNRARDTIVSLAKASEVRMNPKGWQELNKTFHRLKSVTDEDPDQFRVQEVVLVDTQGVVLSSSQEGFVLPIARDRKPDSRYAGDLYTRAYRMRKWQYPESVVLPPTYEAAPARSREPQKTDWLVESFLPYVYKWFPEVREEMGLVSCAVYHEAKLDVLGAVHLTYSRGNFQLFLVKQMEIFSWMMQSYALVALAVGLGIVFVFVLFSGYGLLRRGQSQKIIAPGELSPPLLEKVVLLDNNSTNTTTQDLTASPDTRPDTPQGVNRVANQDTPPLVSETATEQPEPLSNPSGVAAAENTDVPVSGLESSKVAKAGIRKRRVVDAIYLGKYGN